MTMAISSPNYPGQANTWTKQQTFKTTTDQQGVKYYLYYAGLRIQGTSYNAGQSLFNVTGNNNTVMQVEDTGSVTFNAITTTLNGTTAGSVVWAQDLTGTVKRLVAYLNGYENTGGTAQTITFPTAFTYTPTIITQPSGLGATVSTSTLTLPTGMSGAVSGVLVVEGI